MASVSPGSFGLYADVPDASLDDKSAGSQWPEADAEQLLAPQAQERVRLERERGQRCALAKGLAILDKAPKVSDILQS